MFSRSPQAQSDEIGCPNIGLYSHSLLLVLMPERRSISQHQTGGEGGVFASNGALAG
jgi:hypothetical protein